MQQRRNHKGCSTCATHCISSDDISCFFIAGRSASSGPLLPVTDRDASFWKSADSGSVEAAAPGRHFFGDLRLERRLPFVYGLLELAEPPLHLAKDGGDEQNAKTEQVASLLQRAHGLFRKRHSRNLLERKLDYCPDQGKSICAAFLFPFFKA